MEHWEIFIPLYAAIAVLIDLMLGGLTKFKESWKTQPWAKVAELILTVIMLILVNVFTKDKSIIITFLIILAIAIPFSLIITVAKKFINKK